METSRLPLLVALVLAVTAGAADAATITTEGMNALAADAVFKDYGVPGSVATPGCALGVIRAGRLEYAQGYGAASLEHGIPIDPLHTVFDLGSTSKQFTAASVLLLAHDGKLALDDDIRKWLPEVPDYGAKITISHLLHHTSGLRDYIDIMYLGGREDPDHTTVAEALAAIARQKQPNFAPGAEFLYSNSGYFLLSLIVERASGQTLGKFAAARIFAPIGMRDTFVLEKYDTVVPRKATAYEPVEGGGFVVHLSDWEQTGDGAVQTTVADLAKWDAQFYAPTLGGPWLFEQLQEQGTLANGRRIDYARGLNIEQARGRRMVSHGGAWAGFRAQLLRVPDAKLSVAVLCNRGDSDPGAAAKAVAALYLGDEAPAQEAAADAPGGLPPADTARWVGRYYSASSGLVRDFVVDEGKLWYARPGGARSELVDAGDGRLRMIASGGPRHFTIDGAPGQRKLHFDSAGELLEFVEVAPLVPSPALLREFAGTYTSEELGTRWTLAVDADGLRLTPRHGEARALLPAFADTFTANGPVLRFHRDANGQVDGFAFDQGRVRNLEFVRQP